MISDIRRRPDREAELYAACRGVSHLLRQSARELHLVHGPARRLGLAGMLQDVDPDAVCPVRMARTSRLAISRVCMRLGREAERPREHFLDERQIADGIAAWIACLFDRLELWFSEHREAIDDRFRWHTPGSVGHRWELEVAIVAITAAREAYVASLLPFVGLVGAMEWCAADLFVSADEVAAEGGSRTFSGC